MQVTTISFLCICLFVRECGGQLPIYAGGQGHHLTPHQDHYAATGGLLGGLVPEIWKKAHHHHNHGDDAQGLLGELTATDEPREVEVAGPTHPLIAAGHLRELERLEAIDWGGIEHKAKITLRHGSLEFAYTNESCFKTCAPLRAVVANMTSVHRDHASNQNPPGSLSLVFAWCCEKMDWALSKVAFQGTLTQVWIYDKCSRTGVVAKDNAHIKVNYDKGKLDLACPAPEPDEVKKALQKHNPGAMHNVEVHVVDATEPGRSSCMSTDECGAYLRHITDNYDNLTDGIFFTQSDDSHEVIGGILQIVGATKLLKAAPPVFFSLNSRQTPGGNPMACLDRWNGLGMFDGTPKSNFNYRSGANRNGVFYASRLVVRRRPWEFWRDLNQEIRFAELCLPYVGKKACTFEGYRPRENTTNATLAESIADLKQPLPDGTPGEYCGSEYHGCKFFVNSTFFLLFAYNRHHFPRNHRPKSRYGSETCELYEASHIARNVCQGAEKGALQKMCQGMQRHGAPLAADLLRAMPQYG